MRDTDTTPPTVPPAVLSDAGDREMALWERHFARELSPAEVAELHGLLVRERISSDDVALAARVVARIGATGIQKDGAERLRMIHARLQPKKINNRASVRPFQSLAAAVVFGSLLILGIGILSARFFTEHRASRDVQHTYATASGQQAAVRFANGSQVLLGPASTLIVSTRPSAGHFDFHVIGQALFAVPHAHSNVVRVFTDRAVAKVLGTVFMVRQYPTDLSTRIVVTEGRVSLSSVRDSTSTLRYVLTANTLGTVNDSGQVRVIPHIAAEMYTEWTAGKLVFRNAIARDAVLELGRAYGVDIRITDSALAAQRLDATVTVAHQSLTAVLESLVDILDAHPVRTGQIITLVPGRRTTHRPIDPFDSSPSTFPERQYGR